MAQYTPKTWTTGETITAAELNAIEQAAAAAAVKTDADAAYDAKGAATSAQAAAVQRANHTGTQSADTLTDGTTNKAFLATERVKLTGVATGATANATDAQLRDRSTHTGTQAASTVTGLASVATSGAYADLSGKPAAGLAALTPTATKTAAYAAVVGDLAMMNVPGGATTLTLPTVPADKAQVGYRAIGATAAAPLTITAGGSDSIGTAGATNATIVMPDETVVLQYDAPNTRWLGVANVRTQASLDAAYPAPRRGLRGTNALPVASNTTTYSQGLAASGGGAFSRIRHLALTNAYDLRLVYGNFDMDASTFLEAPGPNPITVRASVELSAATDTNNRGTFAFKSGTAAYTSASTYSANDAVTFGGKTYVAKSFVAASNPPVAGGNTLWSENVIVPVHFAGESAARDVTILPGQVVVSEPVGVEIAAGAYFFTNTLVQPNNGTANTGQWPLGQSNYTIPDFVVRAAAGVAPPDYTTAGPAVETAGTSGTTYGPMAVVATPKTDPRRLPVVVLIGDSLGDGAGDNSPSTVNTNERAGWMMRAFGPTRPNIRITKGGDSMSRWVAMGTSQIRRSLVGAGSHMVNQLLTNDVSSNPTLAALQTLLLGQWKIGTDRGLYVWQGTCTPQTNSTDSWATTANQTARAGFGAGSVWEQINLWLRDGAPLLGGSPVATGSAAAGTLRAGATGHPLAGVIDVAADCTDSTVTWAWKVNGTANYATADGTHPTTTISLLMAARVDVTKFVLP